MNSNRKQSQQIQTEVLTGRNNVYENECENKVVTPPDVSEDTDSNYKLSDLKRYEEKLKEYEKQNAVNERNIKEYVIKLTDEVHKMQELTDLQSDQIK